MKILKIPAAQEATLKAKTCVSRVLSSLTLLVIYDPNFGVINVRVDRVTNFVFGFFGMQEDHRITSWLEKCQQRVSLIYYFEGTSLTPSLPREFMSRFLLHQNIYFN